jgi:hypothetical protein
MERRKSVADFVAEVGDDNGAASEGHLPSTARPFVSAPASDVSPYRKPQRKRTVSDHDFIGYSAS